MGGNDETQADPFRSKERANRRAKVFLESWLPKINAEQSSLPTLFPLVPGVRQAGGRQKSGLTLTWVRSLVTREKRLQ